MRVYRESDQGRAMLLNASILIATVLAIVVLWLPRLRATPAWLAMTTPLASIIGSGFLVLGPVLASAYGWLAPAVMGGLCAVSWAFGSAIRHNIRVLDEEGDARPSGEERLETLASTALGFAYMISVAYYLNLFGAFGLSLTPLNTPFYAKLLTSAVFVAILLTGWIWGFRALERMEYVSVSIKLAIIAGLIAGLAAYFAGRAQGGRLVALPVGEGGLASITIAFGLIVTVQGFETSRYLGDIYPAKTRIRSMRWAQILSTVIYLVYIALTAYVFPASALELKETAIVDMMRVVAPVLPAMLVAAALAAQFSAAVADTGGSGGLLTELTADRISERQAYALLVCVGLALTWTTNLFGIISYASRAFALYYGLQAAIAALAARRRRERAQGALFAGLAVLGALIAVFGRSVEGN